MDNKLEEKDKYVIKASRLGQNCFVLWLFVDGFCAIFQIPVTDSDELEIVSLPVDWCEAQVASDYSSWHLHLGDVGIGLEYGTKNNAVSRNKQLLAQHSI